MSYIERQLEELAREQRTNSSTITDEATETYLALSWEVRKAIRAYATVHRISFSTAVAEACRSYFMPE